MTDPVRTPVLTGRHHAQPCAGPTKHWRTPSDSTPRQPIRAGWRAIDVAITTGSRAAHVARSALNWLHSKSWVAGVSAQGDADLRVAHVVPALGRSTSVASLGAADQD